MADLGCGMSASCDTRLQVQLFTGLNSGSPHNVLRYMSLAHANQLPFSRL